jgi:uncharacterized protein
MDQIIGQIAKELSIRPQQVESTVGLLDAGNTVPFISRYRKEATGELNEEQIRNIEDRLKYLRNLRERKEEVIRLIDEQGQLTDELSAKIMAAEKLTEVEDLYRPYRPKRRTRATIAKEKGLEPLADLFWNQVDQPGDPGEWAAAYVDADKGVASADDALQGAQDIVAERISDNADLRKQIRNIFFRNGSITTAAAKPDAKSVYEMYYDYGEPVYRIAPHRVLAINRGEREEFLTVKIVVPEQLPVEQVRRVIISSRKFKGLSLIEAAIVDAYERLIAPSIEREVRGELTEKAEEQAIHVFGANLKNLLLQPPVRGQVVLGVDPAYRTGCKLAVVDDTGKVLHIGVIYPTLNSESKYQEGKKVVQELIAKFGIDLIVIGNGTASRETEAFIADTIKSVKNQVAYTIVSEAGASVYSASKLAAGEFPDLDVSERSAISIARRIQDPLAELVKIEPKAVGVGQYQHDVDQKRLDETLTTVVESAVNSVGVDLNTASPSLLQYVSGVKANVAKNIVSYRETHGRFKSRKELLKVPRLGESTFTQCAGFLRIPGGVDPLDNTSIHPESYEAAEKLVARLGESAAAVGQGGLPRVREALKDVKLDELAGELGVGVPTLKDIIDALNKPGRDPRDEMPKPIFRTDVLSMDDIYPGLTLQGTVRNVVDFGAFVDIGVKRDGLVHKSELGRPVNHPMEAVAVGDIVTVTVLEVDRERGRISLTMR